MAYEDVAAHVSDDLAVMVCIERSEAEFIGGSAPRQVALRVTHVFRREAGVWRLVHRHADALVAQFEP